MVDADKVEFAKLMVELSEYYAKPMSDGVIGMYWQGLVQYDLAAVHEAANRHAANPDTGQFMPKIADFKRMLGGSTQDKALIAWAKVDRTIRQVGTYQSVVFDDPLIHRVVQDMGGWIAMGQKTEDDWPHVAREFENRYRGYSMRSERPAYPAILIGVAEAHNAKGGFMIDPPVLIGNESQARLVQRGGTDLPPIGFTRAGGIALDRAICLGAARNSA